MTDSDKSFQLCENKDLVLPAKRIAFLTLKEWLKEMIDELDVIVKNQVQLTIICDEIFTNIVDYGYPQGNGTIAVSAKYDPSKNLFELKFVDSGIEYNPLLAEPPSMNCPIEQRQVGGLGIFLVKKMVDFIEYQRENGQNILIIKKYLIKKA